jgi:hypothetical protein
VTKRRCHRRMVTVSGLNGDSAATNPSDGTLGWLYMVPT